MSALMYRSSCCVVMLLAIGGCARHAPAAVTGPAGMAPAPAAPVPDSGCLPDHGGYLRVRIRGAQNFDLDWPDSDLTCEGGPRPDQSGLRLTFAERSPDAQRRPRLVFGVAARPGAGRSRAVPANVTLILEGENQLYSTRGDDKCTLDELVQVPLGPSGKEAEHAFRVSGRGFCTAPATSLDGKKDVLVSRFDFAGRMIDGEPADHPQ